MLSTGTTLVTEGNATIHAARALAAKIVICQRHEELIKVHDPLGDRRLVAVLTRDLHETGGLAHRFVPFLSRCLLAGGSQRLRFLGGGFHFAACTPVIHWHNLYKLR